MQHLFNMGIVAAIGVCLYALYYRNLFECAIFLGQCFFALLLAMALLEPVAAATGDLLGSVAPYVNAAAFLGIWGFFLVAFPRVVGHILKEDGRAMRFQYERLGRVGIGIISGLLVSAAVNVNLVMLPQVEGLYFEDESHALPYLHRTAAKMYSAFTFTFRDVLMPVQMEAGGRWAKAEMERRLQKQDIEGGQDLAKRFEDRYARALQPEPVTARRKELVTELEEMVQRRVLASLLPSAKTQAKTASTADAPETGEPQDDKPQDATATDKPPTQAPKEDPEPKQAPPATEDARDALPPKVKEWIEAEIAKQLGTLEAELSKRIKTIEKTISMLEKAGYDEKAKQKTTQKKELDLKLKAVRLYLHGPPSEPQAGPGPGKPQPTTGPD